MPGFAELELAVQRRDGGYALEMRFTQPGDDAETRLLPGEAAPLSLDGARLRELALDTPAYGRYLGERLFAAPEARAAFERARTIARSHDAALRLRLHLAPSAAELQQLRWETLCDPADGAPLTTGEGLLFSRYLSSADLRPVRLRAQGDLKALVAIAGPRGLAQYGLAPIDALAELKRAYTGLAGLPIARLVGQGKVTLDNLEAALRGGYDILYLVCHGVMPGREEPTLFLDQPDGSIHRVGASELVRRVQELSQRPRLIVLASCQSAGTGEESEPLSADGRPLAALGPRLAEAGVPAVVAMQGRVSMATVGQFMPAFFRELRRDGQIDRAMAAARASVAGREDAWMPVLFMRLKSGRIWYTPGFGDERDAFTKWPALIRSLRQGRCTPILGAGLIEPLVGSTREIAQRWARAHGYPLAEHQHEDLPQVAQYVAIEQGEEFLRGELHDALRAELLARFGQSLPEGSARASLDKLIAAAGNALRAGDAINPHTVLAAQPLPIYLTTSADTLLEDALRAAGKTPTSLICPWNDEIAQGQAPYEEIPSAERPLVYHLFGMLSEPYSLVLTEDDYFNYLIGVTSNRKRIPEVVRRALADAALVFLGFRVDDWQFRVLFRSFQIHEGRARRRKYTHVAAQLEPEEGRIARPQGARRYLESYFKDDDVSIYWGAPDDFMRDLCERLEAAARAEEVPA